MLKKLIICILLITSSFSIGQNKDNKVVNEKKTVTAHKKNNSINIDGILDESDWKNAETANNFFTFEPDNGNLEPENLKTEVKVLYDDDAIYIGATLYDDEPSKILKEIAERDILATADVFGVFINGYNDGQQDFQFYISAANGQSDCNFTSQEGEDYSWNAIWTSKTKITDFGWVVELKIPYAALRFPSKDIQTWGINFFREVRRKRQKYTWSLIDNNVGTFSQQAGILKGIKNITPPTRLFLIPYVSAYGFNNNEESRLEFKGGLDIKYGISDAFTLDAILVPDFGQTKFDNVVLNLGPFEQQFNENRPFFTEGTDLFNKGNLLYSRRIGAVPNYNPPLLDNEEIVEYPSSINLLNAVKVSGRDKNGMGIGFLNAITEKTSVSIKNTTTNQEREAILSPLTNYNVTVLDQRFNQNSSVTFINTNVYRNGDFRDANVTGVLFDLNTKKNTYNLSGNMKMSSIYDANKTKSGIDTALSFGETSGNVRFSLAANYVSKDYDNNDLGINFQTNYYDFSGNVNYRILKPTTILNSFRINTNSYVQFNNETNEIQQSNFSINIGGTNKQNHYFSIGLNGNPFENFDYYEPRVTGRYAIYPKTYGGSIYFSSNYNYKFALDINPYFTNTSEKGRNNLGVNISPRYRFNDKFSVIYNFDYFKQYNNVGWTAFDAGEIVFGKRDRDTYTNSLSGKYSINSNMNFNLSVRHYWSFVENNTFLNLQEDGTFITNTTFNTNRDSNFNTWNLDLTYSWWFAPGSQATVLYRNNAFTQSSELDKDFSSNFSNLFSDNLNQVFSISIRYFIDYNQAKGWIKKS